MIKANRRIAIIDWLDWITETTDFILNLNLVKTKLVIASVLERESAEIEKEVSDQVCELVIQRLA